MAPRKYVCFFVVSETRKKTVLYMCCCENFHGSNFCTHTHTHHISVCGCHYCWCFFFLFSAHNRWLFLFPLQDKRIQFELHSLVQNRHQSVKELFVFLPSHFFLYHSFKSDGLFCCRDLTVIDLKWTKPIRSAERM